MQETIRYIAVFTLFAIPVARGFASIREAINCLDRVHSDSDSSPMGIYDATMAIVISYQHENYVLVDPDEDLIIRLAQSYIEHIV